MKREASIQSGDAARKRSKPLSMSRRAMFAIVLGVVALGGGLALLRRVRVGMSIKDLADPDASVRLHAVQTLRRYGVDDEEAVAALMGALGDSDERVRRAAALALLAIDRIGPEAKEAVPVLIAALEDPDARVRSDAAEALGRIGPGAQEAVRALTDALGDPDPRVRSRAAGALGMIGPEAKEAATALTR